MRTARLYNARMTWWMWIAGGLALMVLELAAPSGFFMMFFGLGALTGALTAAGIASGGAQWLLFAVASLGYLLLFRGKVQDASRRPPLDVDSLVGVLAVPQGAIGPGEAAWKCAVRRGARATLGPTNSHQCNIVWWMSWSCCSPSAE